MSDKSRRMIILALATLAYFVFYPEDAQAIAAPIATLLNLTNSVSPWLYGVLMVGIIAAAIVRTRAHRVGTETVRTTAQNTPTA